MDIIGGIILVLLGIFCLSIGIKWMSFKHNGIFDYIMATISILFGMGVIANGIDMFNG